MLLICLRQVSKYYVLYHTRHKTAVLVHDGWTQLRDKLRLNAYWMTELVKIGLKISGVECITNLFSLTLIS